MDGHPNYLNRKEEDKMEYKVIGKKIIQFDQYESFDVAMCDEPEKAINLKAKFAH